MTYYLTPLHLSKEFLRSVHSQCCYPLMQLRYSPVLLIRNTGIQIVEHEPKTVNFAEGTTAFLRDITCLKGYK